MALSRVISGAVSGIDGYVVEVEVDLRMGLPGYCTVGLPDTAVKESRERVKAAIRHAEREFPLRHVLVNLAPAHIRKEGPSFDLPIALGILQASEQIAPQALAETFVSGELALTGVVRPVRGMLPMALAARRKGFKKLLVSEGNAREASLVEGMEVCAVRSLSEAVAKLEGLQPMEPYKPPPEEPQPAREGIDFSEVRGQALAKRALLVAAAGGHNILMMGPPGSGKTMLARRFPSILPPLNRQEAEDVTMVHSVLGLTREGRLVKDRPFRSPHHTISEAGLVGGGSQVRPGEVSLAHHGVLFLDEFPEFSRDALEALRQPVEEGWVHITRAQQNVVFPARFSLVAAMNPCPCGYRGDGKHECLCAPIHIQKYQRKMSGPLMDRLDLQIEVPAVPYADLVCDKAAESSASLRAKVLACRERQSRRLEGIPGMTCNAQMTTGLTRQHCRLDNAGTLLVKQAIESRGFSARAYERILKVARTIADLAEEEKIRGEHVAEAVHYRCMDQVWK